MKDEERINICLKILSGEAEKHEIESFHTWLEASEVNRKYFNQVSIVWERLNHSYDHLTFNTSAAKQQIIEKIHKKQLASKGRRIIYRFSAAAAILLLFVLSIAVMMKNKSYFENYQLYAVTHDTIGEIVLPDSSHVWLNKNSKLFISENFGRNKRNLTLEGEAYFDVRKDSEKPFRVNAGSSSVTVLGTAFNLLHLSNGDVNLVVSRGKVKFSGKGLLKKEAICMAGEEVNFINSDRSLLHSRSSNPNFLSWKTGILVFDATPLSEVCEVLSKQFNVHIISGVPDKELLLTGTFADESLIDILSTIELIFDVESKRRNDTLILY